MNIEIESIDHNNVVMVRNDKVLGYQCRFRCPFVSGEAIIVPYEGRDDKLRVGNIISVETDQESVSEFKIADPDSNPAIKTASNPGDYKVVGKTVHNTGDEIFDIDVGDFSFVIDIEESKGIIPKIGDKVSFKIHRLSLWEDKI